MKIALSILNRLKNNDPTLVELDLSNCSLNDRDISELATALEENYVIEFLNLDHNHISFYGGMHLAAVLEKNRTLKFFSIKGNQICFAGLASLVASLKKNSILKCLGVGNNNWVVKNGGYLLSGLLKKNVTLESLEVENNTIDNEGAELIAKALQKNTTILALDVKDNNINPSILHTFNILIARNKKALADRRQNWFNALLWLATASISSGKEEVKTFPWAELPQEIKVHILSFVEFKGKESIGMDGQKSQQATEIIFSNTKTIKEAWNNKRGVKLMLDDKPGLIKMDTHDRFVIKGCHQ